MLTTRAIAEEWMDAPSLSEADYVAAMRDLARVNSVTLARRPTLAFLARLMKRCNPAAALRILDVGFGDGDMLRAIGRLALRTGQRVELVGVDCNPRSRAAAASVAAPVPVDWRIGDYATLGGEGWDVVISSLVAHHMTHAELVAFLRFMDGEAFKGWFINDLHRHGFAYAGFPLLARLMRWHPIVRHDGRLSIARSYRPSEWPPILAEAGIADATVSRFFPFRLCVAKIR